VLVGGDDGGWGTGPLHPARGTSIATDAAAVKAVRVRVSDFISSFYFGMGASVRVRKGGIGVDCRRRRRWGGRRSEEEFAVEVVRPLDAAVGEHAYPAERERSQAVGFADEQGCG
jgi:hypothetical protein